MHTIYMAKHVPSGYFYIGSTSDFKKRITVHKKSILNNTWHLLDINVDDVEFISCFEFDDKWERYDIFPIENYLIIINRFLGMPIINRPKENNLSIKLLEPLTDSMDKLAYCLKAIEILKRRMKTMRFYMRDRNNLLKDFGIKYASRFA